jgi:hypothetical protein
MDRKLRSHSGSVLAGRVVCCGLSVGGIGTNGPFGDYDSRVMKAIQDCWYNNIPSSVREVGRVVITFNLWENGGKTGEELKAER